MSEKILSIIVPSYNMEKYLSKCLGSLVLTDRSLQAKLDIIVVNDGSKDRTSEIAHEWGRKIGNSGGGGTVPEVREYECSNGTTAKITDYGIVRVIDKPNANYGSCINAALPVAQGVFVKVLDADDSFDTSTFMGYVKFLESVATSRCLDLVINDRVIVDEMGKTVKECSFPLEPNQIFPAVRFFESDGYYPIHTIAYRTDLLREMGYCQLEGFSYTDSEWSLLPMGRVETVGYYPGMVYRYLYGRAGQTMDPNVRRKNYLTHLKIVLHMASFLKNCNGFVSKTAEAFVRRHFVAMSENAYRILIFNIGSTAFAELNEFDRQLKVYSPEVYETLGDKVYSRRLSFHFIKAFRCSLMSLKLMVPICRLYSRVISK